MLVEVPMILPATTTLAPAPADFAGLPELVAQVLFWIKPLQKNVVDDPKIASLACVSRTWAKEVERKTFKSITLTEDRLDAFEKYCVGHRRNMIKSIYYQVDLASWVASKHNEPEDDENKRSNDESFQRQLSRLFNILCHWPSVSAGGRGRGLELTLNIRSSSDQKSGAQYIRIGDVDLNSLKSHENVWTSFLTTSWMDKLAIPAVTQFKITTGGRKIWPTCMMDLVHLFPNANDFEGHYTDSKVAFSPIKADAREWCTESIALWPKTLKSVYLRYDTGEPSHKLLESHTFITGGPKIDPFSRNLGVLAGQLESLTIWRTVIDPVVFFDTILNSESGCPNLRNLKIGLLPSLPNGEWLFEQEPPHRYVIRKVPKQDLWNNIYLTAAEAAVRMPRLISLSIEYDVWRGITWENSHTFTFRIESEIYKGMRWQASQATACWTLIPGFSLHQSVLDAWRHTADVLNVPLETRVTTGRASVNPSKVRRRRISTR